MSTRQWGLQLCPASRDQANRCQELIIVRDWLSSVFGGLVPLVVGELGVVVGLGVLPGLGTVLELVVAVVPAAVEVGDVGRGRGVLVVVGEPVVVAVLILLSPTNSGEI